MLLFFPRFPCCLSADIVEKIVLVRADLILARGCFPCGPRRTVIYIANDACDPVLNKPNGFCGR